MKKLKYTALFGLMLSSGAYAAAQNEGFVNIDEYTMHGTMNIGSKPNNNGAYIRARTFFDPIDVSFYGRDEQGDEFKCGLYGIEDYARPEYELAQKIANGMTNGTEIYLERQFIEDEYGFTYWRCSVLTISKDTSYFD